MAVRDADRAVAREPAREVISDWRRGVPPIAAALVAIGLAFWAIGQVGGVRASGPDVAGELSQGRPRLTVASGIPATAGELVRVPVRFASSGAVVSSIAFSIDFDAHLLQLDARDSNGDGAPDALSLRVPGGFLASAQYDPLDVDGEIDVLIADVMPPLAAVGDGDILTITFGVPADAASTEARVAFAREPLPSFGGASGESVPGGYEDGTVAIAGTGRAYLPLAISGPGRHW